MDAEADRIGAAIEQVGGGLDLIFPDGKVKWAGRNTGSAPRVLPSSSDSIAATSPFIAAQNIRQTSVPVPGDHSKGSSVFRSSGWCILRSRGDLGGIGVRSLPPALSDPEVCRLRRSRTERRCRRSCAASIRAATDRGLRLPVQWESTQALTARSKGVRFLPSNAFTGAPLDQEPNRLAPGAPGRDMKGRALPGDVKVRVAFSACGSDVNTQVEKMANADGIPIPGELRD